MSVDLRPRPTTYRGIKMRSRLEAAFAERLDRRDYGFTWTYEPECFASPAGQYLPDFELISPPSDDDCPDEPRFFIEVKPPGFNLGAAITRMLIIRESIPDADLLIVYGDGYPSTFRRSWSRGLDGEHGHDWMCTLFNAGVVYT